MKTLGKCALSIILLVGLALAGFAADPTPLARWSFEDSADLGKDTMGYAALTPLVGSSSTYDTPSATNGIWGTQGVNMRRNSTPVGNALISDAKKFPTGNSPFTVTAWLRSINSSATAYIMLYMPLKGVPGAWTSSGHWCGWYLRFGAENRLCLCFGGWHFPPAENTNIDIVGSIPNGSPWDGTWHHVAFSRDENNLVRLYWDGVKIAEHTISSSVDEGSRLTLGSYEKPNYYNGDYDEVSVFDTVLSDVDIARECYRDNNEGFVVDEQGQVILDAPAGTTVTNEISYVYGSALVKTGEGTQLLYHSSTGYRGSVGVTNGLLRTGERSTFCNAQGFAVAEGATLEFGRSGSYAVPFTGAGTVRLSGAGVFDLTGDLAGLCGSWSTYLATVNFGTAATPVLPAPASSLKVESGGFLAFNDSVTVASLSGGGRLGGVSLPDGKTLTVSGAEDAAFAGVLAGKATLRKEGAGTLVLSGPSDFTEVKVAGGALALDRAIARGGRLYRFEDADEIGADSGAAPALPLKIINGKNTPTGVTYVKQVEDGVVGKAVHVEVKGELNASFLATDATAAYPRGTTPYTFSAWLRPQANCSSAAYIARCQTLKGDPAVDWTDTGWGSTGWYLFFHGKGRKISIDYPNNWQDGDARAANERATGEIPEGACCDGRWHHVAFTLDADKALRLYWDGELIGENLSPVRCSVSDTARLQLGSYEMKPNHPFNGDFDEVQYVEGAWSVERVAEEYAARVPSGAFDLPKPLAHWTFDAFETDENGRFFRDFGSAGWNFYERTKTEGRAVTCLTAADAKGAGVNGGAAYVDANNGGAFLRVGDYVSPKATLTGDNPDFTLSLRFRNCDNNECWRQVVTSFGNAQGSQHCLRLIMESVVENATWKPRCYRVIPGSVNKGNGWELTDTYATAGATSPWTVLTVVNKAATRTVSVYRDGTLLATYPSYYLLDLDRILIFAGYYANDVTPATYTGFAIDDMRVYRELLTPEQVAALAYDQAGLTPGPLANATVDLAAESVLKAKDGSHVAAAVTGAGAVEIADLATFGAKDWTGFTGTVSGAGALALYGRLPAGMSVSAPLLVAGVETDLAGTGLPVAEVPAGTLRIAAKGVVRVTDAQKGSDLIGRRFILATAASLQAPTDLSGWTLEPSDPEIPYAFTARNGVFSLKVKGGGSVILLR